MLADVYQRSMSGQLFDDFRDYVAANYTLTKGTGGTAATVLTATSATAVGASGGWLNLPTAASQHDYYSISSQHPSFELLAKLPVVAEARICLVEAATNSSNWYFGLTDTLTTGLVSNAGVPASSFNGAVFYKPAGASTIKFMSSNGTTQQINANVGTFVSGTPLLLTIAYDPANGVTGYITPAINSQPDKSLIPIPRQPITLSGLAPMYLSAGVNASTAAAETLQLDYWGVDFYRN
jgi:hypothetical protein